MKNKCARHKADIVKEVGEALATKKRKPKCPSERNEASEKDNEQRETVGFDKQTEQKTSPKGLTDSAGQGHAIRVQPTRTKKGKNSRR